MIVLGVRRHSISGIDVHDGGGRYGCWASTTAGFQASEDPDGQDIADPLYGNANGPDEKARTLVGPLIVRPQAAQSSRPRDIA